MDRQERNTVMQEMYETHRVECKECNVRYPFGTCEEIATIIMDRMAELEAEGTRTI